MSNSDEILKKSTKGATFLMLAQLFTKIITFLLNSVLVRFLSPRIFGITAFLEFILGTVLFFSREAIRLSTLRIKDNDLDEDNTNEKEDDHTSNHIKRQTLQTMVNFSHIPLWIGIPLSLVLTTWQYTNINAYFITLPFFQWSILIIWVSMLVELLSEPFYIVNQFLLNYNVRSRFESIAVTMGCLVNFSVIYLFQTHMVTIGNLDITDMNKEGIAILAFALAKLTHAITLLLCYYWDYLRNFKPKKLFHIRLTKITITTDSTTYKKQYYFQNDILEHFKKVYFQLCFKHLLTEGDKLIINSMCTVEEQGIYSLLSNYGSLVTRLLFAPIEESLRLFLARLLTTQNSRNLKLSMDVLVNLTKFYLYLSLLIIIFGPVNSSFLLQFLIGSKWSTTAVLDTIRVYCFYLPFLSMNGIFEAFFQSVATGDQILKHSYFMMAFSGIFLVNCWVLIEKLDLSINGLIISNIINMILRIIYCILFIKNFYRKLYTTESSFFLNFHNFRVVSVAGISISIINWVTIGYVRNFKQLFINATFALLLLLLILVKERTYIKGIMGKNKLTESKEI
ncbi:similar to Saccharomyces cerevisiae YBL020W RFT1 Essential integral membrane protein [Maudiozyma saulgeensis]|uniref:Man(5)GlcNAc(2)-PP-dolichol translocation protein RFT1 n=1 Tax=Maudiozyma saulgeensis TaxID=1789683 RepID=A0A1X7QYI1_9SACH|nr:similar to Saccharomyces cerevisiae YBL020W RFT1 Essential integral membrane protein [Kazachstania saulgeensis]